MPNSISKDKFYSETISNYSDKRLVNEYIKRLFPERRKEIQDIIIKFLSYLKKNAKVLDLGSGTGKDVNFFRSKGFDASGIDYSKQMIEYAKSTYGNHFTCLDVREINKINNTYDGIFSLAVLQHIHPSDIDMVFSNLKMILKIDGIICLITKYGEGVEWDNRLGNSFKRAAAFYKITELENYMAKYNFNVIFKNKFSLLRENKDDVWLAIIGINKSMS